MKKNYLAITAVFFSFILQAFTNPKRFGCDELLYWFKVKYLIACEEVVSGDLTIPPIQDLNHNNMPDELNSNYLHYASQGPFGCTDGDYACAVGFRANQLRENGFTHFWEPINPNEYVCCVRQPD